MINTTNKPNINNNGQLVAILKAAFSPSANNNDIIITSLLNFYLQ
jgi:hypothetical protein